jgi:hypothetical protein
LALLTHPEQIEAAVRRRVPEGRKAFARQGLLIGWLLGISEDRRPDKNHETWEATIALYWVWRPAIANEKPAADQNKHINGNDRTAKSQNQIET